MPSIPGAAAPSPCAPHLRFHGFHLDFRLCDRLPGAYLLPVLFSKGFNFVNNFLALGASCSNACSSSSSPSCLSCCSSATWSSATAIFSATAKRQFLVSPAGSKPHHFSMEIHRIHHSRLCGPFFLIAPGCWSPTASSRRRAHGTSTPSPSSAIALFIVLPGVAGALMVPRVWRDGSIGATFQVVAAVSLTLLLTFLVVWFKPESMPDDPLDTRVVSNLDHACSSAPGSPNGPGCRVSGSPRVSCNGRKEPSVPLVFSCWCCSATFCFSA